MGKRKRFTVRNINRTKRFNKKRYSSGMGFSHKEDAQKYANQQRKSFNRFARIEKTKTRSGEKIYLVWKRNKRKRRR